MRGLAEGLGLDGFRDNDPPSMQRLLTEVVSQVLST